MRELDLGAINLNLLPALEALLTERGVGAAARRMHVTQSAMSHSLAKLRELFGDPILVPSGRRMALTPRAERLAATLPHALEQLHVAIATPEPFDARTSQRTFRIATVDYFELTMLPDLLRFLGKHAPGIGLEIERYSDATPAALLDGEVDLALIGDSARSAAPGLRRAPLFRDPFAVIARPDHPAIGRTLTLETYLSLGHVLVSIEGRRDGVVDRALTKLGTSRRVALRVPHFVSAPLAVMESDHVCTIASTVARRARELFRLRVLEPPIELPSAGVVASWSRRHDEDPAHAWLRELFLSGRAASPRIRELMRSAP